MYVNIIYVIITMFISSHHFEIMSYNLSQEEKDEDQEKWKNANVFLHFGFYFINWPLFYFWCCRLFSTLAVSLYLYHLPI